MWYQNLIFLNFLLHNQLLGMFLLLGTLFHLCYHVLMKLGNMEMLFFYSSFHPNFLLYLIFDIELYPKFWTTFKNIDYPFFKCFSYSFGLIKPSLLCIFFYYTTFLCNHIFLLLMFPDFRTFYYEHILFSMLHEMIQYRHCHKGCLFCYKKSLFFLQHKIHGTLQQLV